MHQLIGIGTLTPVELADQAMQPTAQFGSLAVPLRFCSLLFSLFNKPAGRPRRAAWRHRGGSDVSVSVSVPSLTFVRFLSSKSSPTTSSGARGPASSTPLIRFRRKVEKRYATSKSKFPSSPCGCMHRHAQMEFNTKQGQ